MPAYATLFFLRAFGKNDEPALRSGSAGKAGPPRCRAGFAGRTRLSFFPKAVSAGCGSSAFVPAGENAFDLLLVPRLISNLVFQTHLEADVAKGIRLAQPLVVVRDRLFLGP